VGFKVWSRLLRAKGGLAAMGWRARAPAVMGWRARALAVLVVAAAALWCLAAAAAGDADAGGLERA